ncbi:hypothetical protein AUC43_10400 [Hymenobacter sedentarius]|uniref:Glycosyltransferase RgtA/B/C/D-like domain-containing protein n=1 Tax=Hymenobacter sedentarius TaxID=1411621 RepID=A0A0U4AXI5_9BACT|nr:hypothetical protein [Hymenobacter sedentarius]ALW85469.1 hypothetical protein AUC43_10400 [Hymenobacter sedentarius]
MLSSAGTNNGHQSPNRLLWLLAALLAVALLRLWRLPETGPPDFDSVRNWQVIQELAQGNFAHLFHHGSPGFLLLYVPVAAFTCDFLVFQTINALLGLLGLGIFAAWVAKKAELTGPETACLVLLGGTSLLLTFSGRDFTMSSVSLVVFAGLLQSHFARLQRPSAAAALRVAAWLAVGLCVNYKFLFALPILALLEIVQADGLWRQRGLWWRVLLVLAAPYVLFGALGVLVGLPWYRWLAVYIRTVVPAAANVAGRKTTLHLDLLYYLRYLAGYESPLLLVGLVLAVGLVWRDWRNGAGFRGRSLPLLPYLLVLAGCLLAGMSLLIKAPRGLLFAYLPLAALAVLGGRRVLPAWALAGVVLAAVGLNLLRIQRELYAPLPTRYPQVAAWLQQHGGTKVVSTVGTGLAPYLNESQTLTIITDERQLAGLRARGYQYVLLDGYWRVAGVHRFDSLRRQVPVAAWAAPELQRPLLFLEHSEFTGLEYAETLAAWRGAAADTLPLRLYRLN